MHNILVYARAHVDAHAHVRERTSSPALTQNSYRFILCSRNIARKHIRMNASHEQHLRTIYIPKSTYGGLIEKNCTDSYAASCKKVTKVNVLLKIVQKPRYEKRTFLLMKKKQQKKLFFLENNHLPCSRCQNRSGSASSRRGSGPSRANTKSLWFFKGTKVFIRNKRIDGTKWAHFVFA